MDLKLEREELVIHRTSFTTTRCLPIEKVRLSPGQAGLIFGWGIFTTLRISARASPTSATGAASKRTPTSPASHAYTPPKCASISRSHSR